MSNESKSRRQFLKYLGGVLCAGGASALIPQLRLMGSAMAATNGNVPGYRALVCVYLSGGNDSFNTLIPYDTTRHAAYTTARGGTYNAGNNAAGLGIARTDLTSAVQITDSATGALYALNPGNANYPAGMSDLATLYRQNRVAFIANVGTLTRPITKAEYTSTPSLRPPQLYSHSDQENLWHLARTTSHHLGWGGQVADRTRLNNLNQALSPCISLAGSNRFQVGDDTFPYQMASSGVTALRNIYNNSSSTGGTYGPQRAGALDLLLADANPSPFTAEYGRTFKRARELYDLLSTALASPSGTISTAFPANSFADQLKMVARMIKLSRDTAVNVQHTRQVYFVRIGGFDLHDRLMATDTSGHAFLLNRLSTGLAAFYTALGEIGAQNDVTTFTASEFARTLSSNGNGSDHAWGGVQLVMGGAVNGGRLYGSYPDLVNNGAISFSRGQMIPSTSVDQMAATLARWMGVTTTNDLNAIFPNLPNFASSNLGFMAA
ncbi:DUF1501 domain-containing protein [Tahibacter amnicola]|uniref:DUF1501 domain-containing protein n=1 Tax=Tahibacter amnicola TaxID=2976241 RepID=A0ABY6B9K4_9GAMM|nr:DUF1501 domain-containing protein [Tahibacter amnicola]UXI66741.1 DUF1501 domain-containing protein [Tahibacter amnicola]